MTSSVPGTPNSTASIYFDAPLIDDNYSDHMTMARAKDKSLEPGVNSEATVQAERTTPAAATLNGDDAGVDNDAPRPDDKLSRSYMPFDTKPPLPPKQGIVVSNITSAGTGKQRPESSHPEHTNISTAQSDVVRSPTSISGGSGGGHRREGSTFTNGAAVTGPNSQPVVDESVHDRAVAAETVLPPRTKKKLSKSDREL
jgi:hypothetical protein